MAFLHKQKPREFFTSTSLLQNKFFKLKGHDSRYEVKYTKKEEQKMITI